MSGTVARLRRDSIQQKSQVLDGCAWQLFNNQGIPVTHTKRPTKFGSFSKHHHIRMDCTDRNNSKCSESSTSVHRQFAHLVDITSVRIPSKTIENSNAAVSADALLLTCVVYVSLCYNAFTCACRHEHLVRRVQRYDMDVLIRKAIEKTRPNNWCFRLKRVEAESHGWL
jgi:hypothetical protein